MYSDKYEKQRNFYNMKTFKEFLNEKLAWTDRTVTDEIKETVRDIGAHKYKVTAQMKFGVESRFGAYSLIVMPPNNLKNVGSLEFIFNEKGKLDSRVYFLAYGYGEFLSNLKRFAVFDELPEILTDFAKFAKTAENFAKDIEKYLLDFHHEVLIRK